MKIPHWLHFQLYIDVPFFSIRTHAMNHIYQQALFLYYELTIKIWKWEFNFEIGRKHNG